MSKSVTPVYRVVNGQWERVQGDVRDPRRRYASTSHPTSGLDCLREYTQEEERQRDAEEAEWEAKRPERDAEARRREDEARRFRESLRYENRLIAFLDVLGWAAAIEQSMTSLELTQHLGIAVKGLASHAELNAWQRDNGGPDGWPGDPMVTHFSDSLVLSFEAGRDAQHNLEWALNGITQSLFMTGFVMRGAVVQGPLIHRESLVYGPALVEAYKLERDHAIVPRVILDSSLEQAWSPRITYFDGLGQVLGYRRTWKRDDDGRLFFDYMADRFSTPGSDPQQISAHFRWQLDKWRLLIERRLKQHAGDSSVFQKYLWMANYYNSTCADVSPNEIQRITVPAG